MKTRSILTWWLVFPAGLAAVGQQDIRHYEKEGYHLVWSDEFDMDGRPDPQNWRFEHGFMRNEETQWYQEDNAWCENGMLVIEGRKERKKNPHHDPQSDHWAKKRAFIEYTSASLNTSGNKSWLYGRFEIRAKIDVSDGLWPAFWTLGVDGEWPSNGEIDIMEYYNGKILANIACGTSRRWQAEWHSKTRSIAELGGKSWADDFHVWRMDWTEDLIALYVDDELLLKEPLDNLHNKDGSGFNPFRQPHYILVDLAMEGINGGPLNDTKFPNRYLIDYIRVYQKKTADGWP